MFDKIHKLVHEVKSGMANQDSRMGKVESDMEVDIALIERGLQFFERQQNTRDRALRALEAFIDRKLQEGELPYGRQ